MSFFKELIKENERDEMFREIAMNLVKEPGNLRYMTAVGDIQDRIDRRKYIAATFLQRAWQTYYQNKYPVTHLSMKKINKAMKITDRNTSHKFQHEMNRICPRMMLDKARWELNDRYIEYATRPDHKATERLAQRQLAKFST